jgi:hypothetical protein
MTLRVMIEPGWGEGSIVEVQKMDDEKALRIDVRDVKMKRLYPKAFVQPSKRVIQSRQNLIKHIREFGMRD